MTKYVTIDSTEYAVPLMKVEEQIQALNKYARRTQDGKLHTELIGMFRNHSVVFATPRTSSERTAFESLVAKLAEPTFEHEVTVPGDDGVDYTYTAYFANIKRVVLRWKETKTHWRGLQVDFIAVNPESVPT